MSQSQSHRSPVAFPKQPSEPVEPHSFSHSIPNPATPLIGREQEIAAVVEMLLRPDVRLLTLIGPPGIGKTRLAIEIGSTLADDFAEGTYFVPLAPITEPGLVLPAIAQTVGIKEASGQPLSETLSDYLRNKQVLLVLDNFEQVIGAGPEIAQLLSHCSDLKVLVTSRELLHIYGEHDYPVPPLSIPDPNKLPDLQALLGYEAIELFLQRAQAANPGFELTERNAPAVAEICLRLDGLPLAIELAAARILVLAPEELLARLKNRLKLLTGGARNLPERQRTLEAAIDWSYNLLDEEEKKLFRRLGVFVGGCILRAIEEVCGSQLGEAGLEIETLDRVTSLVGKSLLRRQEVASGESRFMMLETIREYAREKLEESGELDSISDRHCDYLLELAETVEKGMLGSEAAFLLGRLDAEQNNLRAVLEWSLSREAQGIERRTDKGLRLAGALGRYWSSRGYFSEGREWCEQLLSNTEQRPEGTRPSVERAKALRVLAGMTWQLGDFAEARSIYEHSLEMSRALGDEWSMAEALLGLGSVAMWQGEYDFSRSLYEEALAIARRLCSRHLISNALSMIGVILMRKQEYRVAQLPLEESLAISRELGHSVAIATTLTIQGTVAFHLGEYEKAKALIKESLGIARELGVEATIAFCLARLGMIALRQDEPEQSEAFLMEGLARAQASGIRRWSRWYLVGLAEVARQRGMFRRAARLIGASEGVVSAAGIHYESATRDEIERIIVSVHSELDRETFARLTEEGRTMTLDQALELATQGDQLESATAQPQALSRARTLRTKQTLGGLTPREHEVTAFVARGLTNEAIARQLVLSERTVEMHVSHALHKLGLTTRTQLAAWAVEHSISAGPTKS